MKKINIQTFAIPMLAEAIGGKRATIEFDGNTIADLIDHLTAKYGDRARKALFDRDGKLDLAIQILHNERNWIAHDKLDTPIKDGDSVILMLFMAGGIFR